MQLVEVWYTEIDAYVVVAHKKEEFAVQVSLEEAEMLEKVDAESDHFVD